MSSMQPTSSEESYVPQSHTGRLAHSEPAIQSIPIPEGVSEFQDYLAALVKLHDQQMQGALGVPKHLMVKTQSNFDHAKLEERLSGGDHDRC